MDGPWPAIEPPRMRRRELLGAGALALAAAACGGSTGTSSAPSTVASTAKLESQLRIYNWGQYIDPQDEKGFTKKFGVPISESNYTSNEELFTKLQTTKGQKLYDVIVPDADHVRIEKGLGLLMPLNHKLIPNLKNLAPHWMQLPYDPGNVYSVPKDVGITGFTYRTDLIKADLRSWKDFFDFLPSKAGANVNFIESPSEVIGVALNALGFSMNTEDDAELEQAKNLLLRVRPDVNTLNEIYIDDFSAGKIALGITYSGDGLRVQATRAKQGHHDIKVVAPEGRSEIWIDNWAISADAPDPVAAHAWINYILQPDVNAHEMKYVAYQVPTPASYPLVGALASNPLVVFGPRILNDYEILRTTPVGLQKRQAIWTAFTSA